MKKGKERLGEEDVNFSNFNNESQDVKTIFGKEIIQQLVKVEKELENIREEIRGNKLDFMDIKNLEKVNEKFNLCIDNFDKIKTEKSLSEEEEIIVCMDPLLNVYLYKSLNIQTLISRIAHKKNKYENDSLLNKYREKLGELEKIVDECKKENNQFKEENIRNKESTLTISSLVFTAFTLIQLNFVAFQNSNSYGVLDRIILFVGVNLFLVLGVYCILCMIKSFFNLKVSESNENYLVKEIKKIAMIFLVCYFGALGIKWYSGKIESSKNYSNDIKLLNESLEKYKVENQIANLKLKELEEKLQLYKTEQLKLENKYKKLRQRVIKSNSTKTN